MKTQTVVLIAVAALLVIAGLSAVYLKDRGDDAIIGIFSVEETFKNSESTDQAGRVTSDATDAGLATVSCTQPGYDVCSVADERHSHECATAQVSPRLAFNGYDSASELKQGYVVGAAKVEYQCTSGQATYVIGGSPMTDNDCSKSGCPGTSTPGTGEIIGLGPGGQGAPLIKVYCFDYDRDECGGGPDPYWADSWSFVGYSSYWDNIRVTECVETSDCGSGQKCNKDGDYTQWHCEEDLCAGVQCGADHCSGNTRFYDSQCNPSTGQCDFQDEQCAEGFNCQSGICNAGPCVDTSCGDGTCQTTCGENAFECQLDCAECTGGETRACTTQDDKEGTQTCAEAGLWLGCEENVIEPPPDEGWKFSDIPSQAYAITVLSLLGGLGYVFRKKLF